MMTKGTDLHPDDQRHVLSAYIYRMTTETQRRYPDIAKRMKEDGWRMPEQNDQEWLATTSFQTRVNKRLDQRYKYCHHT